MRSESLSESAREIMRGARRHSLVFSSHKMHHGPSVDSDGGQGVNRTQGSNRPAQRYTLKLIRTGELLAERVTYAELMDRVRIVTAADPGARLEVSVSGERPASEGARDADGKHGGAA